MEEWKKLTSRKYFISDLIENKQIFNEKGQKVILGRYAVWAPSLNGERHQIVEVSSDLEFLKKKYNIPNDLVLSISIHSRHEDTDSES